ncbi:MAG: helix-turn-helix transcriptional regulator [Acidobacteriota bacterium]|jgi:DNA-binding PadR family transcriptional regulator
MPTDELSDVMVEILLTLSRAPQHGYAIKLDIEERAGGGYVIGSGSLYQALHRLERRGLIAVDDTAPPPDDARRGKVYRVEPAGREALDAELTRIRRVLQFAEHADSGGARGRS